MIKIIQPIFNVLWRIFDWSRADMCPQGGHRIVSEVITNECGTKYCLHRDCLIANMDEIEQKLGKKMDRSFLD